MDCTTQKTYIDQNLDDSEDPLAFWIFYPEMHELAPLNFRNFPEKTGSRQVSKLGVFIVLGWGNKYQVSAEF